MVIDGGAIRRLQAMDIEVWRLRARDAGAPATGAPARRIRMEAGSGCWLLVVDDAERDRHAVLLEDIRATLGANECRFGTWSDSPDAGIGLADFEARGIRHALVFDGGGDRRDGLVHAAPLEELGTSGQARRALWQLLSPLLER